jgi:hypothetical protein
MRVTASKAGSLKRISLLIETPEQMRRVIPSGFFLRWCQSDFAKSQPISRLWRWSRLAFFRLMLLSTRMLRLFRRRALVNLWLGSRGT